MWSLKSSHQSQIDRPETFFQDKSWAETIVFWTIVLTPLWWLLGIQTLFYPAVVIGLLIVSLDLDKLIRNHIPLSVWAWLAMAITMLWTAFFGLSDVGFNLITTASTLVTCFKGYFLIFACLLLPFTTQIRIEVITRAVVWMAIGYLVLITFQLTLLFLGIHWQAIMPPLAKLTPGNKLSLVVKLSAVRQNFFGVPIPRSSLYMPDPPIPGICGLLALIICWGEKKTFLRNFAIAGCLGAILVSQSRLAWVCLPIAIIIMATFRGFWARQLCLWLFSFTALFSSFLELTFSNLLQKPWEIFNKARPASTTDRAFVVQKTLEAWRESPWLGWGIVQDTADWHTYKITLGSFSTYAAVLYLHGIVGFIVFLVALGFTLADFWQIALTGNILGKRAFASLIVLYIFIQGLPLSWITVYIWFFFIWLGIILATFSQHKIVDSWKSFSQ